MHTHASTHAHTYIHTQAHSHTHTHTHMHHHSYTTIPFNVCYFLILHSVAQITLLQCRFSTENNGIINTDASIDIFCREDLSYYVNSF